MVASRFRMRFLLSLFAAFQIIAIAGNTAVAQSGRYVLTSVDQNIDVEDWQITARDTGVSPDVPWSRSANSDCTAASRTAST